MMALPERIELYNLADIALGVDLESSKSRGLTNMMQGYTRPVKSGSKRVCFKNSYYAELLKVRHVDNTHYPRS